MTIPFCSRAGKARVRKIGLSRFRKQARGVAAVEFALILPVLVLILAIAVDLSEGFAIEAKMVRTTRTITDMVAQQYQSVSATQLAQMLGAASAVMAPYGGANLGMVVSEVQTDSSGNATVTWSQAAFNGVARTIGQTLAVPTQFAQPNASLILGEVSFVYVPLKISTIVPASFPLSANFYVVPRQSTSIALTTP